MTTELSPLSNDEVIFQRLVWNPLIEVGEKSLRTAFPVLNTPGLSAVDHKLLSMISDWLFSQFRLFVDISGIELLNVEHQALYNSASEKLSEIARTEGVNSDAFNEATQDAAKALSRFTRFTQ